MRTKVHRTPCRPADGTVRHGPVSSCTRPEPTRQRKWGRGRFGEEEKGSGWKGRLVEMLAVAARSPPRPLEGRQDLLTSLWIGKIMLKPNETGVSCPCSDLVEAMG